jgi:hypothetical protein
MTQEMATFIKDIQYYLDNVNNYTKEELENLIENAIDDYKINLKIRLNNA